MLKYIFLSFLQFLVVLCSYVIYMHIFKPKVYIKPLFTIFLAFPLCASMIAIYANLSSIDIILTIELLYFSITAGFIQTYPAIYSWAPSLKITYIMGKNNKLLTKDMLKKHFNTDNLVMDRFRDLQEDGFIKISKGNIDLTLKGKFLADFFYYYRKLLGLKEGNG